jgi:hypothetical protein
MKNQCDMPKMDLEINCKPIKKNFQWGISSVSFISDDGSESKYVSHLPSSEAESISEIQSEILDKMIHSIDKTLRDYFEPYLKAVGIDEVTKNKLRRHGVKMISYMGFDFTEYQLMQRGKKISPVFRINYPIGKVDFINEKSLK